MTARTNDRTTVDKLLEWAVADTMHGYGAPDDEIAVVLKHLPRLVVLLDGWPGWEGEYVDPDDDDYDDIDDDVSEPGIVPTPCPNA